MCADLHSSSPRWQGYRSTSRMDSCCFCGGTVSDTRGGTVSHSRGGTVSDSCGRTVSDSCGRTVSDSCGRTVSDSCGRTVSDSCGTVNRSIKRRTQSLDYHRTGLYRHYWLTLSIILHTILGCTGVYATLSESPPVFTEHPQSGVVKQFDPTTLRCTVSIEAGQSVQLTWTHNGHHVTHEYGAARGISTAEGILTGSLTIDSFKQRPRDESNVGVYNCVASNSVGTVVSQDAILSKAVIGNFDRSGDVYINATEGNVASLPCHPPASEPKAQTLFEVNTTIINRDSARHKLLPSGNLQIDAVKQSDQGLYHCTAVNAISGTTKAAHHHVHLRVVAPVTNAAPRIIQPPELNVNIIAGETLTLECVVEGSPVPVVTWNKYGGILPNRATQVLGNLVITNIEAEDEGTYICNANNQYGQPDTKVSMVTVLEHPRITSHPQSLTVTRGNDARFECAAHSTYQSQLIWLHDGVQLQHSDRIEITKTQLTIHNSEPTLHNGVYQCVVKSPLGVTYSVATLSVVEEGVVIDGDPQRVPYEHMQGTDPASHSNNVPSGPVISEPPQNHTCQVGSTATFSCSTTQTFPENYDMTRGHNDITVSWYKDGAPISANHSTVNNTSRVGDRRVYFIEPDDALVITEVTRLDDAQYTCVAFNQHGYASRSAYLNVQDVVLPPGGLTNRVTARPITMTTNHRNNNGHAPINQADPDDYYGYDDYDEGLDYLEEDFGSHSSQGGGARGGSRNRPKRPRDRARTRAGNTPKMIPPTRPEVTKLSDSSVMLEWDVPSNDGLQITFFKVQYKEIVNSDRKMEWQTIEADIPENIHMHEVSGLRPGGTYKFRIVAVYSNNDNKHGPNSLRFTIQINPEPRPNLPTTGPVIVEARPTSENSIMIRWQYLPIDQSPIEGFYVSYKPYASHGDYSRNPVLGPNMREHMISGLSPDNEYSIKIQAFNTAGESDFSNSVVKRTLAPAFLSDQSGPRTMFPPTAPSSPPADLGGSPVGQSPDDRLSTESSNQLLYIILGIVLGIMLLLLVIFMIMCSYKQRQQRRMMDTLHADINKFQDPSRAIYNVGNSHPANKQQLLNGQTANVQSPFLISSIQPVAQQNGRGKPSNGYANGNTAGNNMMNINVNPMSEMLGQGHMDSGEVTAECESDEEQHPVNHVEDTYSQPNCANCNENVPVIDPQNYALDPQTSHSSNSNSAHGHQTPRNPRANQPVEGLYHTEPLYYEPPDYHVLENPPRGSQGPQTHNGAHYSDSDMAHSDYSSSHGAHQPASHGDKLNCSYDGAYPPHRAMHHTGGNSLPRTPRNDRMNGNVNAPCVNPGGDHSSASQSSSSGGKPRKHRRRRQHRDMQSHAECSSNDGTMESPPQLYYPPPPPIGPHNPPSPAPQTGAHIPASRIPAYTDYHHHPGYPMSAAT